MMFREYFKNSVFNAHSAFTMVEVLVALFIIGLGVTPLIVDRGRALDKATKSVLLQEAMLIAEKKANEIFYRGYAYYQSADLDTGNPNFECTADFSVEEINIPDLFEIDEGEEGEKELERFKVPDRENEDGEETDDLTIVVYHITVTVSSKEENPEQEPEIRVIFTLEIPEGASSIKDAENLLTGSENDEDEMR